MKTIAIIGTAAVAAILIGGYAISQTDMHQDMDHTMHSDMGMDHDANMDHSADDHTAMMDMGQSPLNEPGQGAFAALSEVVRVLEADPDTDWSKVDINGLRDHLIDMDILVRDAVVTQEMLENGVLSTVTGDDVGLATAKRMLPAHGGQLANEDRWVVEIDVQEKTVSMRVTSDDPATIVLIKALGFYGLMASQDHHRAHHFIMATGGDAHSGH